MKTYKVSAVFYEYIEAKSEEEAIKKFENTDGESLTLDSESLKAERMEDDSILE